MATPGLPAGTNIEDDEFEAAENTADSCFIDIYSELMKTEQFPVMIAVDEYSELFQPSPWHYKKDMDALAGIDIDDPLYDEKVKEARLIVLLERIPAEKLTVVAPFLVFRPPDDGSICIPEQFTPKRGMVIVAETHNYPVTRKVQGSYKKWPYFDEILGTSVDPWVLEVSPYSEKEYYAAVSHYFGCDMFSRSDVGNRDVMCVRVKTAMNPKLVFHKYSFKSFG